jgi:DNA-binding response OmpR family regulator
MYSELMRILVVEDEHRIANTIKQGLEQSIAQQFDAEYMLLTKENIIETSKGWPGMFFTK